ncbi:haloacid dehalogenase type II [Reyranella sp.]|uniref:haloacid dehalogenase type II n=1 Tax=Reyranella sp. TaxID=1929291 RepID=UPI0025CDA095|nr:haloacid dehalogenase type II [Reyranella sp.]
MTRDALEYALDALDLRDAALADRLMSLYLNLNAFPEVPEALRRLKSAGLKTAILSNGTPQMLEAVVSNAGLGELFDHVISVEAVGVFKTDPKVYQLAVDRLGVARQEIAFQSSNAWDAYAASAFGMRVVWCNRYGQRPERLPGKPDRQARTLADLIPILGL